MEQNLDKAVRPIRSEADYRAALAEIDELFAAEPGSTEADRLEVLCILVAEYERKTHPVAPPDPVEFLSFAMRAQGRTQADLAEVLGSRSRASEVLSRKRHLSADMIAKLSERWSLPRDLLSAPYAIATGARQAARRAFAAAVIVLAVATAGIGGVFWSYGRELPSMAEITHYTPPELARYDADGRLVEYRRFVPLSQIPPHVVKAFLAAEDQDYYAHAGYSLPAIMRAAMQNLAGVGSGRKPSGGSTITQQLAKNLVLTGEAPSLDRKIKELILASRLERALSKDRILELYLNQIYFGGHAFGIAAAAQQYFGKRPDELSIAEAAYLAALPKAPNHYRLDVADNRARAKERRDWVLRRMADDGLITVSAAHFAQAEPLTRH
ncbi:transglycosylase domain-containing protein [Rhodoligotrophos defluvii]|uniref:transglycosylase domain-containing protein n=1 Tax=Rhodoligotrophos defluvii TaxID=2561934 RepID=UPI0010C9369F|nr:transglycosylase domain-containing protein [Rhodoligotrophos defluvii]